MRSRGAAAAGLGRAKVAVQDTRHFRVNHVLGSEKEVEVLIETGQVQLRYIIVPVWWVPF